MNALKTLLLTIFTIAPISTCSIKDGTRCDLSPIQDNMLIGSYYYPWYSTTRHWQDGYKGNPILGEYSSRDTVVIDQHIKWAVNYGIDFFLISWWGPASWEDITFKDYILESNISSCISYGILYETYGRLTKDIDGNINFDNIQNIQRLKSDFEYLAENYFSNTKYFKIDNKPVIFIYLTRTFVGNYQQALSELRSTISSYGYELYLIGDQVYWQSPNTVSEKELMSQFDAITAYNMHISVPDIDVNFISKVSTKYSEWFDVSTTLSVSFIPNVMPGFNDTEVRPEENHPVITRSYDKFTNFCKESLNYLSYHNIVLITSWNEWHEYTQIEPDDNYKNNYLNIIRNEVANYR